VIAAPSTGAAIAPAGTLRAVLMGRVGLSPVMVGRDAELGRLLTLRPGPDPEVAFIGGEGGVGKTRLALHELAATLRPGTPVLVGGASPGGGRPFAALQEAVEAPVARWTGLPAGLAHLAAPLAVVLGPAARHLGLDPQDGAAPSSDDVQRAAVELVRHLVGGHAGALVVFDDLHWADPESVALFGRLATTQGLPILLVATYRAEELGSGHPVASLLVELERRRSVCHVTLGRLTQAQVGELLSHVYRGPVSHRVSEALHRRTGGNPFFVEELVLAAGDAEPERLAELPLPWTLTETVLRHLEGLDDEALRVVDAAAVLGRRIPFDQLAALTGLGEDALIDVLRVLVGRGLLVEGEPDVFAFRHALTHEAVEARLLGRERRRLHAKALTALQEAGSDDFSAMAAHARAAGRWDDMVDAARAGARCHIEGPCASAPTALQLAELGLSEAEDDLELHRLACQAAWLSNSLTSARRHGARWRALAAEAGDDRSEFQALCLLGRAAFDDGDHTGMWEAYRAAFASAERLPRGPELALASVLISEAHMLSGQPEEAIDWADRALAVASEVGDDSSVPRALVNKGSALLDVAERTAEGMRVLEQALVVAEAAGDDFNVSRAEQNMLSHQINVWPIPDTRRAIEGMLTRKATSGQLGWNKAQTALMAAEFEVIAGDRTGVETHLRQAERFDPDLDEGQHRQWHAGLQAMLAMEVGDHDAAETHLARLRSLEGISAKEDQWTAGLEAQHAAALGDGARVARALTSLRRAAGQPANLISAEPLVRAVAAAIAVGLPVSDLRAFAVAVLPTDEKHDWHQGTPDLVEGLLLSAEGRSADTIEALMASGQSSLGGGRGGGRRRAAWIEAMAGCHLARATASLGDREAAHRHAAAAVEALAAWPGWRHDEAVALERQLAATPTTPSADGPGGLTAREREVAALVAEGRSNGQIAQALYISTKTASVHVSNILTKLGLSNRAEIAAWWVRHTPDPGAQPPAFRPPAR
jgi:DNA-binding CsgD family transcriptional regulator/tetratricopeptide (TPR) repeat protein